MAKSVRPNSKLKELDAATIMEQVTNALTGAKNQINAVRDATSGTARGIKYMIPHVGDYVSWFDDRQGGTARTIFAKVIKRTANQVTLLLPNGDQFTQQRLMFNVVGGPLRPMADAAFAAKSMESAPTLSTYGGDDPLHKAKIKRVPPAATGREAQAASEAAALVESKGRYAGGPPRVLPSAPLRKTVAGARDPKFAGSGMPVNVSAAAEQATAKELMDKTIANMRAAPTAAPTRKQVMAKRKPRAVKGPAGAGGEMGLMALLSAIMGGTPGMPGGVVGAGGAGSQFMEGPGGAMPGAPGGMYSAMSAGAGARGASSVGGPGPGEIMGVGGATSSAEELAASTARASQGMGGGGPASLEEMLGGLGGSGGAGGSATKKGLLGKLGGKGLGGIAIGALLGLFLASLFKKMYSEPQQMQTQGDLAMAGQTPPDLAVQQGMLPRQAQQNAMLQQVLMAQMMPRGMTTQSETLM